MATALQDWIVRVTGWVPRGHLLSDARWPQRHRAMLWVLWLHVPALGLLGVATHHGVWHVGADMALLGSGALVASNGAFIRRVRTTSAVVALVSCSAVLVHYTDGLTESHFHFFAVVAFITLYQEWLPFALTLVYVVVHHGIAGVMWPSAVYNHEAAWTRPVLWAFIHAGFVLLMSLASLSAWRLAEVERETVERVLGAAGDGIYGVDRHGRITFVNPLLCDLLGVERKILEGMDHHTALGHHLATGDQAEEGDCPLCLAAHDGKPFRTGEGCLRGSGDVEVPVEYITRPVNTHAPGQGRVVTVRDLRERRRLEDQRRTAEAERDRLASIVEACPDLVAIGRPDGTLAWMNMAGQTLLGLASAAEGGYRIEDLFSSAEIARIYAEDMPVIAQAGHWQGLWTLQAQNGTQIPVSVTAYLHPEQAGDSYYVSAIMRDLRPQLAEERERRENERRLAAAEGVAGMGSWEWDLVTNKVMWSPGMYRLHGMPPGDGQESFDAWLATVHPNDREMALERAARMPVNNTDEFTYRAVRADGREVVIHTRGEVVANGKSAATSIVGTLQDITDQHVAAEALRLSEERARSVIATAGDAYVQFDCQGRVTEWNHQAEATFGLTREEAIGRSFPALVLAPSDWETVERRVGLRIPSADRSSVVDRFEVTMLHRSGRQIPVEVTAWMIRSGDTPVFSSFIRDISERLAAERAKNEFVSVVGHELRTPLTSIHGALRLLQAGLLGELNDRGRHMAGIAVHNTDRLVRLINDILDIERLNSGTVSLQPRDDAIATLVERSVDAMRPMADASGVQLEIKADNVAVWADPDRVEQTLTNLLSNAIKFSPHGGQVWVTARATGGEVTVEVRDQGRGIPTDHLERIFDRFQQVDGSDSREKGGAGLGLAICRTIVEQHGGRIWAESTPGEGATVRFTVPLARPRQRHPTGAGPKVVVCDDDASVRDAVSAMLRNSGYEPVEVGSTAQLRAAVLVERPAAIVVDLRIQAAEGWQPGIALDALPDSREIPVVFLALRGYMSEYSAEQPADCEELIDADVLIAAVDRAVTAAVGSTLLLVEDDQDLADVLIERFARLGLDVRHAATARAAVDLCGDVVPDLVVLDLMLPDQDGYALVAELRGDERLRSVPLAVYTACDLSESERDRLTLGETRFFTKGRVSPGDLESHVIILLDHLTETVKEPAHA